MSKTINTYLKYAKQISKILTDKLIFVGKKYNLSKMEAHALLFFSVESHEPIASEFCKCGAYPKSNVSKAILNLSKRGFIIIESRELDRRYQEIKLTEKGIYIAKEIRKETDPILSKIGKDINDEQKKLLMETLSVLKRNVDNLVEELSIKNKE